MNTTTSHPGAGTRALVLVFLAAIIEGFDLQAAGVAAPKLGPHFGLGPNEMGLFFSSATFGLIFGAISGGMISDRWGRRAALSIALVLFGIFSIATAFAGSFEQLVFLRFVTGVGLGGALPNLIAIAAESAPPEHRGRAVAIMYAGVPLGGMSVSILAMQTASADWPSLFLIGGILPLLLVVPLYTLMAPFRVVHNPAVSSSKWQALFARGTISNTVLLWSAFFFGLVVLYMLLNWLPQLTVSLGFDRGQASMVQILFNVGAIVGCLFGGRVLDGARPAMAAGGIFVLLAVAIVLLAEVPAGNLMAVLAAGAFIGATLHAAQTLLYAIAPQCYPAEVRGTGVGIAVSVGRGGSIAGPLLAGVLLASGMGTEQLLYTIIPVAAICGIASVVLIARHIRQPVLA